MKRLLSLFEKPLFKTVTESNNVKFIKAWNKRKARRDMYQLVGSENFTIKKVQKNEKINRNSIRIKST